jgi:hypothetical protein
MINTIEAQYTGALNMSHIRVTFDSPASALAFANKWKLEEPADAEITVQWHLLPQVLNEQFAVGHALLDTDEHEFLVKGEQADIEEHATIKQDLGNGYFLVSSSKAIDLGKAVDSIDHNAGGVTFLGVSSISEMSVSNTDIDPTSSDGQWARIRVASAYRPLAPSYSLHETTTASKPELYIVDTGCDFTHPEFQDSDLEKDVFYVIPPLRDSAYTSGDQLGHGTSVASMAVGVNLGINTYAKLRVVKIAGAKPDGSHYSANLIELGEALDAVLAEHNAEPNKTRIVNISWGVSRSAYLDSKFQALIDAGITVVAAAGNSGISVEEVTPAGIDDCLTVGATDKYDIPAGFNNISPNDSGLVSAGGLSLDLFAPGESVLVAHTAGSDQAYGIASGTSFAAPLVSGICTVIGSMNENAVLAVDMKSAIMQTATKNALLFEDNTFSDEQNNLAFVFTADPAAEYKNSDMVSYLGVSLDEDIIIDLNSNIDVTKFKTLYPNDEIVYSIKFVKPEIEEKYSEYVNCDPVTGLVTIKPAEGVVLPDEVKLEMVEFIVIAVTPKVKIETNTIFYFNNNPLYADTLNSDVTLALSDVNSISFFAAWFSYLK